MKILRGGLCGLSTDIVNASELLRWWHQYQAQRLNQIADRVRNNLLQDLFAVRRQLELSCQTQDNAEAFGCDRHLASLERIYNRLESLSDSLDSPYAQDSLPLALQHMVQPRLSELPLKTELPQSWEPDPVEHAQLLLIFVERFLDKVATAVEPQSCGLTLKQQADTKQMICCVAYESQRLPASMKDMAASMTPFLDTFRLFTGGEYKQTTHSHSLHWILRWNVQSSVSNFDCP